LAPDLALLSRRRDISTATAIVTFNTHSSNRCRLPSDVVGYWSNSLARPSTSRAIKLYM